MADPGNLVRGRGGGVTSAMHSCQTVAQSNRAGPCISIQWSRKMFDIGGGGNFFGDIIMCVKHNINF